MPVHGTLTPGAPEPAQLHPQYGQETSPYSGGGYETYPSFFPSPQHTIPYAHAPGVVSPYQGQITGYDAFGRPIFKPISPYDQK